MASIEWHNLHFRAENPRWARIKEDDENGAHLEMRARGGVGGPEETSVETTQGKNRNTTRPESVEVDVRRDHKNEEEEHNNKQAKPGLKEDEKKPKTEKEVRSDEHFHHILKGVSGKVSAGETLAILGPSGSGKTSLLKMLGGQHKPGNRAKPVSGRIRINAEEFDYEDYPFSKGVKLVSFIEQTDLFVASVTVREHLDFHANLRLFHMSKERRRVRIARVLRRLRLTHCADRLVFTLSGGEQKRLSIAEELLNEHTCVLLLDEPTSGLDSTVARDVVEILYNKKTTGSENCGGGAFERKERDTAPGNEKETHAMMEHDENEEDVADNLSNTTIIFTIHQPSSLIYSMFKNVYFIGSGGVAFFGPAENMVYSLMEQGFQCPDFYNPAEFALDLIQDPKNLQKLCSTQQKAEQDGRNFHANTKQVRQSAAAAGGATGPRPLKDGRGTVEVDAEDRENNQNAVNGDHTDEGDVVLRRAPAPSVMDKYSKNEESSTINHDGSSNKKTSSTQHQLLTVQELLDRRIRPPFWMELKVIWRRTFIARLRKRMETRLSFISNTILIAVAGAIFWDLGNHPGIINTRNGAVFFFMTHPVFSNAFEAMLPMVMSGPTLQREYQSKRLYRISSFFFARTTGELPITCLFPLIYTCGACLLCRFHPMEDIVPSFLTFLSIALSTMLASTSLGYAVGSLTHDHEVAISILIVLMVPMVIMNGFLVDQALIPPSVRWIKYLSLFHWSFNAYISWCWQGVTLDLCTAADRLKFPDDCLYTSGDEVLWNRFGIDVVQNPHITVTSIAALLIYAFILRTVAFLRVSFRYKFDDNLRQLWRHCRAGGS